MGNDKVTTLNEIVKDSEAEILLVKGLYSAPAAPP